MAAALIASARITEACLDQSAPVLEIRGLVKDYPGQRALDGVDMAIRPGEVRALLGHNGAGKSTVVRILAGATPASEGVVLLCGQPFAPQSPAEARDAGIGVVYQNAAVIENLSVQENLVLGFPFPRRLLRLIDWRGLQTWAREQWAKALGDLEPPPLNALLRDLKPRDRWMVAIARAVLHGPGVLVLDESTVAFSATETEELHHTIRRLAAEGTAVIYVTHRLEEALAVADMVTVLRDGRVIVTADSSALSSEALIYHLAGERRGTHGIQDIARSEEVVLACSEASCGLAQDLSLELHRGEILGLAGLEGSGARDVLRALFGVVPLREGALYVDGNRVSIRSPRDAIAAGLAFVPADRHDQAILLHSVSHNVSLPSLHELRGRLRVLDRRREHTLVRALAERLGIKIQHLDQSLETLSGGNRQKAVLAKWLMTEPKILLLEEPTQAVDVGAAADIRYMLKELATEGVTILIATADLKELVEVCDRVLVLARGRITREFVAPFAEGDILTACYE